MAERWVTGTLQSGRKVPVNMDRAFGMDRIETDTGIVTLIYSGAVVPGPDGQQAGFHFACTEPPAYFLPVAETPTPRNREAYMQPQMYGTAEAKSSEGAA